MKSKTGVFVLEDGGGSIFTRAWLCEYAEKTIDVMMDSHKNIFRFF